MYRIPTLPLKQDIETKAVLKQMDFISFERT